MSGTPSSGESDQPSQSLRDEIAQLHEAVRSQRDIGVAIGLMSARFGCSTEQAWRLMLRVSQDSNTKVRTVARILVATHDGAATPEDARTLQELLGQLPVSGWPTGPWQEEDPAP
jgi:hypothetical protein